jgi:hypothetical protein
MKSQRVLLSSLLMLFGLAACTPQAPAFKITVIVDSATDPVRRADVEAVLEIVKLEFNELSGFRLMTIEIVENGEGGSIERIATDYLTKATEIPNGLLIFSKGDDDRAVINRAYAQQVPGPDGFRNLFVSPIPEIDDSYVYIAVVQFNHLFAACGYGGKDTIQSPVSIGEECRGEVGRACAAWEGMQVCTIALPFLEGRTRIDMVAEPIVHEFLHPFGLGGPDAHYGSEACALLMGWEPDHFDEEEAKSNAMMCPIVIENFANSYHP